MTRGKIAQLNNKNGEHVFPVTSAQVVYMEDGRTSVKDKFEEFGSQLDTIEQDKVESNYLFKRKIIGEFPLCFEDYNQIVSDEKIKYIYPQSFAIDNKTNELFVLYSPDSTTKNGKRWVAVYDIETKKYKSCFQAGNAGGEGIVIYCERKYK